MPENWQGDVCEFSVEPQAADALAALLGDIAAALGPDDPESVVIGPVDFGGSGD